MVIGKKERLLQTKLENSEAKRQESGHERGWKAERPTLTRCSHEGGHELIRLLNEVGEVEIQPSQLTGNFPNPFVLGSLVDCQLKRGPIEGFRRLQEYGLRTKVPFGIKRDVLS